VQVTRALALAALISAAGFASDAVAQQNCTNCAAGATQAKEPLGTWERLTKTIEIRQNTNVKKDIAQPAFVTFTNPDEGPTTYQIGVGVLSSLFSRAGSDVDALVDYQRNTATDSQQDSFKFGATGYWRALDLVAEGHSPLINSRSNFRHDGVKNTKSWQNAVGYTHLFSGAHKLPVPNAFFSMGTGSGNRTSVLDLIYFPYVGLEFDSVLSASTKEEEGTATRGVFQINTGFYPAPLKDRRPVEILLGYTYREDFRDTTNQTDDRHPLFTFEANYFPFQKDKIGEIGFGISYTNGEDPDEGFEQQAFWQFTLKFRLKKQ
jgi:hypothetical protein